MHRKYAQEKHTDAHVCKRVTVLHTTDEFESTWNCSEVPYDSTQTVPKHVAGDYEHLLCIYCTAREVGCISCLLTACFGLNGYRQVTLSKSLHYNWPCTHRAPYCVLLLGSSTTSREQAKTYGALLNCTNCQRGLSQHCWHRRSTRTA